MDTQKQKADDNTIDMNLSMDLGTLLTLCLADNDGIDTHLSGQDETMLFVPR